MKNVKQAVVVRKDLKFSKGKIAELVAKSSMRFFIENNESERRDELLIKLSHEEVDWIKTSAPVVFGIGSQEALSELVFKAELSGVNVYSITGTEDTKLEEDSILCAAIGPDEDAIIDQLIGNLKRI